MVAHSTLSHPGIFNFAHHLGAHDTGETADVAQEESETSVVVTATVGSGHDWTEQRFWGTYHEISYLLLGTSRFNSTKSRRQRWVKSELSTAT